VGEEEEVRRVQLVVLVTLNVTYLCTRFIMALVDLAHNPHETRSGIRFDRIGKIDLLLFTISLMLAIETGILILLCTLHLMPRTLSAAHPPSSK
jgi:hypothetical protein